MKLICSKANLLNGVNTVSKAVPSKTTMSILECILIDATKGQITLTANDMELGIETVIDGEIIEKGIIDISSRFECCCCMLGSGQRQKKVIQKLGKL